MEGKQLSLFSVDTEKFKVQSEEGYVPFVSEVEEFNNTFG